MNQNLKNVEDVIREKLEVDHDRRKYQDGYRDALNEMLSFVVREQRKDPQEPPQLKPFESPVAFILSEIKKTCNEIMSRPEPKFSCTTACPYCLPEAVQLSDGNQTKCMRYVLEENIERLRIKFHWEFVDGISKSGDGYEIKGEKNHTTCNKVQRDLNGSPFCEKSEIMGVFPCDKCNIYEPKKGAEKK